MDSIFHILPRNDSEEHIEGVHCKCKPDVLIFESGVKLVIHNSFDGREVKEDLLREATSLLHAN